MIKNRKKPRTEKNFLIIITSRLGAVIRNTIDISESGLKLGEAEAGFTLGQQVRLTFGPALNETYVTQANVVRCDDNSVALRFEQPLDSETLARVLAA